MSTPSIIVMGPQGCGKTLNAAALAKAYGLKHWYDAEDGCRRLPRTDHLILVNRVPHRAMGLAVVQFHDAIKRVAQPHPLTPGLMALRRAVARPTTF